MCIVFVLLYLGDDDMLQYLIVINIFTFLMYGIDKYNAIKHKNRISEKTLLFLCVIGGCFLGYVSMFFFHHKTRKIKFHVINITMIIFYIYIFWEIVYDKV